MKYLSIVFLLVLAGCQTNSLTNTGLVPNAASVQSTIISDSVGAAPEGIVPIEGIANVSLHADRSLRTRVHLYSGVEISIFIKY